MASVRAQSESPGHMAGATATALVQASAHHAFELFKDREFRRLAGFDALDQADKTWHQAYIHPRYHECFGMLFAELDNIGFAVLSRGLFNN